MAVVLQTLNDGPRNHVIQIDVAGANAAAVVVDASAWSDSGKYTTCDVKSVKWSINGAVATDVVELDFDATANLPIAKLSVGEGSFDWTDVGGIPNATGAGKTGDIVLTSGAGVAEGTVTLHCRKRP